MPQKKNPEGSYIYYVTDIDSKHANFQVRFMKPHAESFMYVSIFNLIHA